MKRHINDNSFYRILCCFGIAVLWTAGIIGGIYIAYNTKVDYIPIGKMIVVTSPSLIYVIAIRLAILFITSALLLYCKWGYVFWIAFLSLTYGLIVSIISCSFGSAGWLMLILVLTPDALLLALLLCHSVFSFLDPFISVRKNILLSVAAIFALSIIECCYVYPFTSALF